MDSRLTLKLKKSVIEQAKVYAAEKKISLSRLIESYLQAITSEERTDFEISPFVRSMMTKTDIPADYDYKKDYYNYLDEKYK